MSKRDWEKGAANPIPLRKYKKFKEKLGEKSAKFRDRNLMLFILGRATGYRMQDLVDLTIADIEDALDQGYFVIQEKKQYGQWLAARKDQPNRKKPEKRRAIIKSSLESLLEEYVRGKKRSEYAFKSQKGKDEYIEQKSFSAILSEIGKELGLSNISGHSLRKTYATKIYYESNNDIEKVRVALGHTSLEETKRYLGLKKIMQDDAAELADGDI